MAKRSNARVRIQAMVRPEVAARIAEWSEELGVSQSKIAEKALEFFVERGGGDLFIMGQASKLTREELAEALRVAADRKAKSTHTRKRGNA